MKSKYLTCQVRYNDNTSGCLLFKQCSIIWHIWIFRYMPFSRVQKCHLGTGIIIRHSLLTSNFTYWNFLIKILKWTKLKRYRYIDIYYLKWRTLNHWIEGCNIWNCILELFTFYCYEYYGRYLDILCLNKFERHWHHKHWHNLWIYVKQNCSNDCNFFKVQLCCTVQKINWYIVSMYSPVIFSSH